MMHKYLSRRSFLKTAGMSGLMLAASPLLTMSKAPVEPKILSCFPFHPSEWEWGEWDTSFKNKTKLPVKVGDTVRFFPEVGIDGFSAIDEGDNFFRHIILNVYEFTFRPVLNNVIPLPPSERPRPVVEDLLVNISSYLFTTSRFRKDGDKDLKVGQLYKGYGTIGNYDNSFFYWASEDYGNVEDLKINARVEKIIDYDLHHTWHENIETGINYLLGSAFFKNRVRTYTDDLLYHQDFSKFKKAVAPYQNKFKELKTNENCALPTYQLRII